MSPNFDLGPSFYPMKGRIYIVKNDKKLPDF